MREGRSEARAKALSASVVGEQAGGRAGRGCNASTAAEAPAEEEREGQAARKRGGENEWQRRTRGERRDSEGMRVSQCAELPERAASRAQAGARAPPACARTRGAAPGARGTGQNAPCGRETPLQHPRGLAECIASGRLIVARRGAGGGAKRSAPLCRLCEKPSPSLLPGHAGAGAAPPLQRLASNSDGGEGGTAGFDTCPRLGACVRACVRAHSQLRRRAHTSRLQEWQRVHRPLRPAAANPPARPGTHARSAAQLATRVPAGRAPCLGARARHWRGRG